MDFKVTSWFERNYKWLSAMLIIFITVYAIFHYTRLNDKSDTFVIALFYALVLFAAGIYFNYMSNTIESKIDERIDIYRNLERIRSTLEHENDSGFLESVRFRITSFKVFTGRDPNQHDGNRRPYISDRGVKFNARELSVEEEFITAYHILAERLTNIIQDYLTENGLTIRARHVSLDSISLFRPETWCETNLVENASHGRRMVGYLYTTLGNIRDDIETLESLGEKVMLLYDQYLYRTCENIRHIERMYGRKLNYRMHQQSEIEENFRFVLERLYEVEDRITTNLNEHDEKIEDYVSEVNEVLHVVNDIDTHIQELQNSVESCVDREA